MANSQSRHPTRRDLYYCHFKQGEAWGEDRRALEQALLEIDEHEREIQRNYIHAQPAYSSVSPRSTYSTSRDYAYHLRDAGIYHPSQYRAPPDVRIDRSNTSDSQSSSEASIEHGTNRPYTSHPYGSYAEFPRSFGDSFERNKYNDISESYGLSAGLHRSSSYSPPPALPRIRTHSLFPPPPPLNSATSSYRDHSSSQGQSGVTAWLETFHYYPSSSTAVSPHVLANNLTSNPVESSNHSGRGRLLEYNDEREEPSPIEEYQEPHTNNSTALLSPEASFGQWPTTGFQNFEDNPSVDSYRPPTSYSEEYTANSGYVKSYEGHPYDEYRNSRFDDSEDDFSDQEFMSDGVASDEGVYCSSEGPDNDFEFDGEDIYSDEGYDSAPSDDYYEYD